MSNLNSSSSFCLFCYKAIASPNKSKENLNDINKFVKVVNRFASSPNISFCGKSSAEKLFQSCNQCKDSINTFCENYNKLKVLELKLDFMLETFVEKINYANKVPSRWMHVNKVLDETFINNLDEKLESQSKIRKIRQNVIQACHQRKMRSQPRVLLKRTENVIQIPLKLNSKKTDQPPNHQKLERPPAAGKNSHRKCSKNRICPKCGKTLQTLKGLKIHLEHHKGRKEWKFMCRVCSKKFTTQDNLTSHHRSHTGERPYKCRFCGAPFGYRSNLTKHLKTIHGNEKGIEKELKRKWFLKQTQRANLLKSQQEQKNNTRERSPVYLNHSDTDMEDDNVDFTEDKKIKAKSRNRNKIKLRRFPGHDNDSESEYDELPELEDYSGDINNEASEEYISTTNMETLGSTTVFRDPLIQIKVEH